MKKRFITIVAIAVAVLLIAGVASSILLSYKIYTKVDNETKIAEKERLKEKIAKEKEEAKNADKENVKIGGSYQILSTTAISDAYKSKDTSKLDENQKKTYDIAKTTLEKLVKDGMTDYDKELAVYTWLVKNVKFDMSSFVAIPDAAGQADRPYGVLKTKVAVCAGFATTFRLFMQMMDIECKVVHDTEASHSWDLVKLEDGWYHVDCTFDSSNESSYYQNFNVDDITASQSHSWDKSLFPEAKGIKYSYAQKQSKPLKDLYSLPSELKKAIKNKENHIYYKVSTSIPTDNIEYVTTGFQDRATDYMVTNMYYTCSEKEYIVGISIQKTDDALNSSLSKDQTKKLDKLLNDLFGESYGGGYEGDGPGYSQPDMEP